MIRMAAYRTILCPEKKLKPFENQRKNEVIIFQKGPSAEMDLKGYSINRSRSEISAFFMQFHRTDMGPVFGKGNGDISEEFLFLGRRGSKLQEREGSLPSR